MVRFIEQAIARRRTWFSDDSLRDYSAHVESHLYFLFDTGRDTERQLVKADQLALDVFWRAPGETRQLFVGRREKKNLPTNINYHLDHLMVVMDNYPDSIVLGEGSEVDGVLHPLARGALDHYEYRLADSLTLLLPQRELWVYRVQVRPTDPDRPGVVGAIYFERDAADVVRMDLTFTSASYLDEQLDYISLRIENALWEGRYWLPYSQGLELRREYKLLSFPAGGIIRSELTVKGYKINGGVPAPAFRGPPVVMLSRERLERYEFETDLYDALDPSIATEPPTLQAVREEAARVVAQAYLQRSESFRLAIPGLSSVLRFRRAEGFYLGPGVRRSIRGRIELTLLGGYAIGADRGELDGVLRAPVARSTHVELAGYVNRVGEVTPWVVSSGVVSTIVTLVDGEDYREPFWKSGATLTLERRWPQLRGSLSLAWEEWESAALEADRVVDRSYRPLRPEDEATVIILGLDLARPGLNVVETIGGWSWQAGIEGSAKVLAAGAEYVRGAARSQAYWPRSLGSLSLRLSAQAGAVGGGTIPAQRLFVAGGRGTVRGYQFNRFGGNLFGFISAELSRDIKYPYLSVAVFGDLGWIGFEGASARRAAQLWTDAGVPAEEAEGALIGAGAGVGLLFDIVRLELARGLRQNGTWEFVFRVSPRFWAWL